jgi:hypothetical protein
VIRLQWILLIRLLSSLGLTSMQLDEVLVAMARSSLWSDRAHAGQALVQHAGETEADALLRELLLDREDSAVIAQTASSLLGRGDAPAWRIFLAAWNLAEPSQADHLMGALSDALFSASLSVEMAASLKGLVASFVGDTDENVRAGAAQLQPRIVAALPD